MDNFTDEQIKRTHPYNLFIELNNVFPKESEWLAWEPEVFLGHFDGIKTQPAKDKLLSVWGVCGNTDVAGKFCFQFSNVVSSFCNYGAYQSITSNHVEDIFYTYLQLQKLTTLLHSTPFVVSGEVPGYVASCAKYYDWVVMPEPLNFAQEILDHLNNYQSTEDLIKLSKLIDSVNFGNKEDTVQTLEGFQLTFFEGENPTPPLVKKTLVQLVGCYLYDPTDYVHSK